MFGFAPLPTLVDSRTLTTGWQEARVAVGDKRYVVRAFPGSHMVARVDVFAPDRAWRVTDWRPLVALQGKGATVDKALAPLLNGGR